MLALHAAAQVGPGTVISWPPAGREWPPHPPRSAPIEESITSYGAPLEIAATVLADRYAAELTYEDPILRWRGDMVLRVEPESGFVPYVATPKRVRIPAELAPERTARLDAAAVGKLLDAYHADNPDAPRFRLAASPLGLHIVPTEARDGNGNWAPAITPLDAVISVPEDRRMAGQHLKAVIAAAQRASGVQLELDQGRGIDGVYGANGLIPPPLVGTSIIPLSGPAPEVPQVSAEPYMFRWGASGLKARDALISLLGGSATTLRWDVGCEPNPVRAQTLCRVSVRPIEVRVTGPDGMPRMESLQYDRCTKCPTR